MELPKLSRPAKAVNKCTLQILEKSAPTVNLFKIRRTKGWWPLKGLDSKTKEEICTVITLINYINNLNNKGLTNRQVHANE